jgi:ubiquinone/menaquinone biosynthesis C-methylase UbiE
MVHVGNDVLDCGAGQMHLWKCLPDHSMIKIDAHGYKSQLHYKAIDPFPIAPFVIEQSAEELRFVKDRFDTVFMLSALDNVLSINQSLVGLKNVAKENIVILTGIGIPPDKNHTVQVDREDLVIVLGEPFQEVEMLPKVWLFEWKL